MIKIKVTQIGNSLGVILPKEALAHLSVKKGDPLFLRPDGNGAFLLTNESAVQMKVAEQVMEEEWEVLEAFAKSLHVADVIIQRRREVLRALARSEQHRDDTTQTGEHGSEVHKMP